ncbi:MAG: polysaccharide biosynthesis/export family protein [Deferribacteres bacterium]|nr:polysaccharide biosynthesis/export family protein [candidate division KSB1 bacterium]MCB9512395.1 polysaccharide biosynthesis/export family protein [Deferribacteres bacterium]
MMIYKMKYILPSLREISFSLHIIAASILSIIVFIAEPCNGQSEKYSVDYLISNGDELEITFWQKPELNTQAKVNAAGQIELPLIGNLEASGMTTQQLKEKIVNRISILDVTITQAAVRVTQFASKVVYVTGAVGSPGKYSFETIPNIWQIILEAGGPLPNAVLSKITIVRSSTDELGSILYADVSKALEMGDFSVLPPIYPGDTIDIGQQDVKSPYSMLSAPSSQSVIYVFGDVASPGAVDMDKEMDVLDALIHAGGAKETADLEQVRVIYRQRRQSEMATIDMRRYLRKATPLPLMLHEGDVIYIPSKRRFSPFFLEVSKLLLSSVAGALILKALN